MAVRVARTFGQLRDEIRRTMKESRPNDQGFSNDLILDVFNRCKDHREMDLTDTGQGHNVEVYYADLVADQEDYSIPTQGARTRRLLRYVASQNAFYPVEMEGMQMYPTYTGGIFSDETYFPTYRILGASYILTPPPSIDITAGLRIELESPSTRITADNDALPANWDFYGESLLVYDAAIELYDIEFAQTLPPEGLLSSLVLKRNEYLAAWKKHIAQRSFGPRFVQPNNVDLLC